jgi:hypothetical protein
MKRDQQLNEGVQHPNNDAAYQQHLNGFFQHIFLRYWNSTFQYSEDKIRRLHYNNIAEG